MQKVFYWAHSSRKLLAIVLVAVVVVAMWRFLSSSMVVHSASNQPTNKPETAQPALSGNTHDAAYSAELNPKLCSELPVPEAYLDNSPAFINIPHPHKIPAGSSVCVRVAVPAAASNASLSYAPFPGTPWDSVLVDLVGQNTGISVPVALQPSSQVQNYIRDKAHIYEADVVLRDADTYIPAGYIEYRNGLWNGEDHDDVVPIGAEQLVVPADAVVAVEDNHAFGLSNYPKLPLCTEPDADGRWIAKDKLPFSTTLPPDNYNRVWLPYDCQLQPYTYKEFAQCLQQKHSLIHWFGDSNTRRALKKITTLGQWCSEPNRITTQQCICNDNAEQFGKYNIKMPVIPIDIDPIAGGSSPSADAKLGSVPANSSRIIMFRWGGLTTRNDPPWTDTFSSGFVQEKGNPSVAIFGLVNWDTAFSTRALFIRQVELLAGHILQSYSSSTKIILRTGQYYCCTYDKDPKWKRKFSRLRNQYFNQYLTDIFQAKLGADYSISVWDVSQIAERRPYGAREEMALACPPNHVRAELIDIENLVLINHLCN